MDIAIIMTYLMLFYVFGGGFFLIYLSKSEIIKAKNQAEQLIFQTEKEIEESKIKLKKSDIKILRESIEIVRKSMDNSQIDLLKSSTYGLKIAKSQIFEKKFVEKTDVSSDKKLSLNFVLSLIIASVSLILPYYYLGSTSVNLFKIADVTKGFNFDIIGALMIIISPIIVLANISKSSIMGSGVLSGLGLLLVLNRAIKVSSAGNDFGSLNPSVGPGLILLGIAAIIQLIGLYQEYSKVLESADVESKNKTEKSNQSLKDGDIPHKIEELAKLKEQGILTAKEFNAKKKELLNRM